jgi:hypothetical protein
MFLLALLHAAVIGFRGGLVVAAAILLTLAALLSAIRAFVLTGALTALLLWVALLTLLATLVALLLASLIALLLAAMRLVLAAVLAGTRARVFVTCLCARAALLPARLLDRRRAAALVILIGRVALVGILLVGIFVLNFRRLTASRIIRIAVFVFFLGCFSGHGVSPLVY